MPEIPAATELTQRIVALEDRMNHERLCQPLKQEVDDYEVQWQRTSEGWRFMVYPATAGPYLLRFAKVPIKAACAVRLPRMYESLVDMVSKDLAEKLRAANDALRVLTPDLHALVPLPVPAHHGIGEPPRPYLEGSEQWPPRMPPEEDMPLKEEPRLQSPRPRGKP